MRQVSPSPAGPRLSPWLKIVKTKRKTEIELQLQETVTIKTRQSFIVHCPRCREPRQMIPADDAAVTARISARQLYRLAEAGTLHFVEDQAGLLYVCLDSLQGLLAKKSS